MKHLYFNMVCKITIGNVVLDRVTSVDINQSIKMLSDTAKIILPRAFSRAKVNGENTTFAEANILDYINPGDPVSIELGYDQDLKTEFTGYIDKVGADVPLELICEDEMYHLRKTNFTTVLQSTTLKKLLQKIADGYEHDIIDDVPLGKFEINNASGYEVLETLRKNYGLHARFKDKVLVVGFPIDITPGIVHQVVMNRNVRAKASRLKFVRKEDFKLLLKAISINSDGQRFTGQYGDSGGSQRTLHFTNKTRDELKKLAEKNHKSLSFDGYQGTLPTWGLPRTSAGDGMQITDPYYPNSERDGIYLIEGVRITFNKTTGFVRANKLGLQL